jgi:iron complex transport system ATP-binding protein
LSIVLENVTVQRGGQSILKRISVKIDDACVTGIVGPNGSGKSSLLRTLYGYLDIQEGAIRLEDRDLDQWEPTQLALHLGVCPQEAEPSLDFQVKQILALRFNGDQTAVIEGSEQLPFLRLSELFERRLSQLSGGERQRVRLGMALLSHAPWLLLDEPANHLDLATGWSLLEHLRKPRRGGVVMALHDLSTAARCCQQILVLQRGEIVAQGSPAEVLTPERLADVFRLEATLIDDGPALRLQVSGVSGR